MRTAIGWARITRHSLVNRPRCPVHNYQQRRANALFRAGHRQSYDAYYEPNSFNGPVEDRHFVEPPLGISGDAAQVRPYRGGDNDCRQAGDLFRLIGTEAQQRLFNNIAEAMQRVPIEITERQLGHFAKADPRYAQGVARALRLTYHPPME